MSDSERKRHARALFAPLAADYDRAAAVLSLGQERRWRERLVAGVPAGASDHVLDVCAGTGAISIALVRRHGCRVTGLDQSAEMLAAGRRRVAAAGLGDRVTLVEGLAERLPFADGQVDHLTVSYLLRYVDDPAAAIAELARVIRPGGTMASLEFGVPPNPVARIGWRMYTSLVLPLVGRMLSREWHATARFLSRSIPDLYRRFPLDALVDTYRTAGLDDVRIARPLLGSAVIIWARRS